MSNISFSMWLSLFSRFDIYIGIKSPFWYWNIFTRTSLSCSKFPIDAKIMGESKVPWLCVHLQLCMCQVVFAQLLGSLFLDQSEVDQYHASDYKQP